MVAGRHPAPAVLALPEPAEDCEFEVAEDLFDHDEPEVALLQVEEVLPLEPVLVLLYRLEVP